MVVLACVVLLCIITVAIIAFAVTRLGVICIGTLLQLSQCQRTPMSAERLAEGGDSADGATPIDIEFSQLRLTRKLRELVSAKVEKDPRRVYEVDAILERWLISMANLSGDGAKTSWATVYKATSFEAPLNQKMAGELLEKSIAPSRLDAETMTRRVVETVNEWLESPPVATGATAECRADADPPTLSLGAQFSTAMTPRMRALANGHPCGDVLRMVLRYEVILGRGQQWGLPQAHSDALCDRLGVRNEGFASPLNSRLLGKPGGKFCSLFPDTDAIFGSLGSFFRVKFGEHPGNWQVNPVFIASMMDASADKVIAELKEAAEAKKMVLVVFLMPAWEDTHCYAALAGSPFRIAEVRLPRNRYSLELPDGTSIVARFDARYFGLVSLPSQYPEKEKTAIRSVLSSVIQPPAEGAPQKRRFRRIVK